MLRQTEKGWRYRYTTEPSKFVIKIVHRLYLCSIINVEIWLLMHTQYVTN